MAMIFFSSAPAFVLITFLRPIFFRAVRAPWRQWLAGTYSMIQCKMALDLALDSRQPSPSPSPKSKSLAGTG